MIYAIWRASVIVFVLTTLALVLGRGQHMRRYIGRLNVSAYAHGNEQFIADQGMSDPVSKKGCCGPSDCYVLADGTVRLSKGGYWVPVGVHDPEFVPERRAMPFSPDGHFHVCYDLDESGPRAVRCLIVPPSPSS
jgi:hypothetical protein